MEMRKGFTLIEMIFVIVISGLLSMGTFKAMEALYVKSAKAQAITELTLRSQIVLDQISMLLYSRIPNSVIGYNPTDNSCLPIAELDNNPYTILEWLGTMDDELLRGDYDGFVDMGDSNKTSRILATPNIKVFDTTDVNLVFSGAFDEGSEESTKACSGAFGWHGKDSNLSYSIKVDTQDKIKLTDSNASQPEFIYEKYYLTNTAYAVARGENLNKSDLEANCDNGNYIFPPDINFTNTLFLFYGYQPFKGETFCGDNSGNQEGNVSILSEDVSAFEAIYVNDSIILNIDMNRSIRGKNNNAVHIAKQKAVF